MFCTNCGKKIDPESKFCPYCGHRLKEGVPLEKERLPQKPPEKRLAEEPEEKAYSPVFWKYFGIGILLNIFTGILGAMDLSILSLLAVGIYVYFFCKVVNEAMESIDKKNWWPLGLLALIPLGYWITFFIVRAQLKPRGKWDTKKGISPMVIIAIVVGFIIIIGILASIVLVSMGGARMKARDAVRKADMRQLVAAQEMYYGDHGVYYSVGICLDNTTACYPSSIGIYIPTTLLDPTNSEPYTYKGLNNYWDTEKFCYYATLESEEGTYYTASHGGNFLKNAPPVSLDDCASEY